MIPIKYLEQHKTMQVCKHAFLISQNSFLRFIV